MDIEKLRSFVTAVSLVSFSEAADELFLTTSAVSKHVAALESTFGTQLLSRNAKSFTLTDAGKICFESAKSIVEEYDDLFSMLGSGSALTVLSIPFQRHIVPLLSEFNRRCPDVKLRLMDMHGLAIVDCIERGEYELGFACSAYAERPGTELISFCSQQLGVLVPEAHPLAGRGSVSISELKNERFCLMAPETGLYSGYVSLCRKNGFMPRITASSPREDTLIALVASGSAVSLFTELEICCYDRAGTRLIPLEEPYTTAFALVKKRGSQLSPSAAALWRYIEGISDGTSRRAP